MAAPGAGGAGPMERQQQLRRLHSRAVQDSLDLSCCFTSSGTPLSRADLLSGLSCKEVDCIQQAMGKLLSQHASGARRPAAFNSEVEEQVLHASLAIYQTLCTVHSAMSAYTAAHRRGAASGRPFQACEAMTSLRRCLAAAQARWRPLPLLLFVALQLGGLADVLVVVLHHHSGLLQLAPQAALVAEALMVSHQLAKEPSLLPLLLQPKCYNSEHVSAWGALRACLEEAIAAAGGEAGDAPPTQNSIERHLSTMVLAMVRPIREAMRDAPVALVGAALPPGASGALGGASPAGGGAAQRGAPLAGGPPRSASTEPTGDRASPPRVQRSSSTELRLSACAGAAAAAAGGGGGGGGATAMAVDGPPDARVSSKRPASTELDELNQRMGVSTRYSPVMLGRAGVGGGEQFGAAAAAAPGGGCSPMMEASGGGCGGGSGDGGTLLACMMGRAGPPGGHGSSGGPGAAGAQPPPLRSAHRQLVLNVDGGGFAGGAAAGCAAADDRRHTNQHDHHHPLLPPLRQQQQQQPLAAAVLESAHRLSHTLHVSPPEAAGDCCTSCPGYPCTATPLRATWIASTPPGMGSPLSPGLDLPATSLLFRPPGAGAPDAPTARVLDSPSGSSSPGGWGTPRSHARVHAQLGQLPSSPDFSTWGSPASMGGGGGGGGGSPADAAGPGAGLVPGLSSRLAAMSSLGMSPAPGQGSPLRRSSTAAAVGAPFAGGGGGAAAAAGCAAGPLERWEYGAHDTWGPFASASDPRGGEAPPPLSFGGAAAGPEAALGASSRAGSSAAAAAAAAAELSRVSGPLGAGVGVPEVDRGGGQALRASAFEAAAMQAEAQPSASLSSCSGGDTAPELDRRRSSRQLPASSLSRPPRRSMAQAPDYMGGNDLAAEAPSAAQQDSATDMMAEPSGPAGAAEPPPGRHPVQPATEWQPLARGPAAEHPAGHDDGGALTAPPLPPETLSAWGGVSAAAAAAAAPQPHRTAPRAIPRLQLAAVASPLEPNPLCCEEAWGSPCSDDSMLPRSPQPQQRSPHAHQAAAAALTSHPLQMAMGRSWDSSGTASPTFGAMLGGGGGAAATTPATPALLAGGLAAPQTQLRLMTANAQPLLEHAAAGSGASSYGSPPNDYSPDQDAARALRRGGSSAARGRHRLASCSEPAPREGGGGGGAHGAGHELLVCRALGGAGGWPGGGSFPGSANASPRGPGSASGFGLDQSLDQGGLAALVAAGACVAEEAAAGAGGSRGSVNYAAMQCDEAAVGLEGEDGYDDDLADQLGASQAALVDERMPLEAVARRYAASAPALATRLRSLDALFPFARRVVGDGNCFYRAFVFALLEAVLARPDVQLLASLRSRCDALWAAINARIAADADAARGHALMREFLERVWWVGEAAGAAAVSAPPPLYLQGLEEGLRSRGVFDPLVRFARLAASCELRGDEERYAPFMTGCGYEALTMAEVCERHVERMGQEVEQLQVMALARALGVTVGILDAGGSDIGYLQHPSGEGLPLFWLLHLPGHYEVVYPRDALDVRLLLAG